MKKLLTIVAISALTLSTLVGCGKTNEKIDTAEPTVIAEPTETVEPTSSNTAETTDTVEKRSTEDQEVEEVKEEVVDLPGYLTDYPLAVGDKKVYIKIPDGYDNFSNTMDFWGRTYDEVYQNTTVYLFPNTITETSAGNCTDYIIYTIEKDTDEYTSKWYEENKEIGYPDYGITSYNIVSETFENGITLYNVESVYEDIPSRNTYFFEYTVDDTTIQLSFIGDSTSIIEYYKTATDIFVVK